MSDTVCSTTILHSLLTGNYTFNVTAANMINCVYLTGTLFLIDGIHGLQFVREPSRNPGEILVPYLVEFQLNNTRDIVYMIKSGTNISVFISCDGDSDGVISANIRSVRELYT